MKKLTIIILISLFCFKSKLYAQFKNSINSEGSNKIQYTVDRNDPESVRKLNFEIFPASLYIGPWAGLSFNICAAVAYDLAPRLSLFCNGAVGYSNTFLNQHYDLTIPLKPYEEGNAAAAFYFINKSLTGPQAIPVASLSNGNYTTTYFFRVPIKHIIKLGIEGGLNYTNSIIGGYGPSFGGYNINDPSQKKYNFQTLSSDINFSAFATFIGLDLTLIQDYLVSYKDPDYPMPEHKDRSNKFKVYFDFLLPTNGTYSNTTYVSSYSSIPNGVYNLNKYTNNNSSGLRLGVNFNSLRTFGFSFGSEVGITPGVVGGPIYVRFNVGMALNSAPR